MKKSLAIVLAAALYAGTAFSQTPAEIVNKSVTLTPPDYSETVLTLDLLDKNGTVTEHRTLNQYGHRKNGLVSTVFDFRSPAAVKGTRILQSENKNKSDDKWIYLPSLKTTRRIANTEKKKSFVGTEFTYNDMTLREAENDEHTFINENGSYTTNGKSYSVWVIKSVPVKDKNVEYSYRIQYIDKDSNIPLLMEFYNKKDVKIKEAILERFGQVKGATGKTYWLRQSQLVKNLETGKQTRVIVEDYTFDKPISDRYFTQNWLNTGK
ncbi:outer membrane lipoprotein-sorting protein [Treponema sp.]|uniref:outer membrane lipoprotein-sorting protein n=1 Tax=Treponema sp. TaxID=166 RepID=UPI0025F90C09|nr:outer membrane lipoprotein-sorting protein [Treponema sp.]MCR5218930.1 outer membrane lipoprotein-sorting protein [Treponema sp.]